MWARTAAGAARDGVESPALPGRPVARRRRPARGAGARRRHRTAGVRAARRRQRAGAGRRPHSRSCRWQPDWRGRGSDHLSGQLATHARRITEAYEKYNQLRVLKRPLQGIYLSLFLTMTLMILVSATWMGLYLAKRITRPVQRLAAGAREIGAGHLDHRIEPETRDEFGSLVEAFNTMASGLAAGQQKLERSRVDLERKNLELDERRRYIETVLERIATGVVSLGADGRIATMNSAALRLLDVDRAAIGTRGGRTVRARGSPSARTPAAPGPQRRLAGGGPGVRAGPRRARAAPRRRRHDAAPRRRQLRGGGGGVRRRDAADPDPAGGGVARRGAPPRPRDQESADADSALRRAHAPPLRHARRARPGRWSRSAPPPSSARSSRSRSWSTSSRSSRACRRRASSRPTCTRC